MTKLTDLFKQVLLEKVVLGRDTIIPLSDIDPNFAKLVVQSGLKDGDREDDKVDYESNAEFQVQQLRPAQTELVYKKAVGIAINYLTTGKPNLQTLNAIVSNDQNPYIMDGHHRWAAAFLINPNSTVKAHQIDLPGPALLSLLNIITKGKLGVLRGNDGTGDIKNFNYENVKKACRMFLEEGDKFVTPEQAKKGFKKVPGANGNYKKGVEIFAKNADKLPKTVMPGAVKRSDMPVIEPEYIKIVKRLLSKGQVDFKAPHSKKVKQLKTKKLG